MKRRYERSDDGHYDDHHDDQDSAQEMSGSGAKKRKTGHARQTTLADPAPFQRHEQEEPVDDGEEEGLFVTPDPEDDRDYLQARGSAARSSRSESPLFVSQDEEHEATGARDLQSVPAQTTQQATIQQPIIQATHHHVGQQNTIDQPLSLSEMLARPPGPLRDPVPYPSMSFERERKVRLSRTDCSRQIYGRRTEAWAGADMVDAA